MFTNATLNISLSLMMIKVCIRVEFLKVMQFGINLAQCYKLDTTIPHTVYLYIIYSRIIQSAFKSDHDQINRSHLCKEAHVRPNLLQMGNRGLFINMCNQRQSALRGLSSSLKEKDTLKNTNNNQTPVKLSTRMPQRRFDHSHPQPAAVSVARPVSCRPWFPYLFLSRECGARETSEDCLTPLSKSGTAYFRLIL